MILFECLNLVSNLIEQSPPAHSILIQRFLADPNLYRNIVQLAIFTEKDNSVRQNIPKVQTACARVLHSAISDDVLSNADVLNLVGGDLAAVMGAVMGGEISTKARLHLAGYMLAFASTNKDVLNVIAPLAASLTWDGSEVEKLLCDINEKEKKAMNEADDEIIEKKAVANVKESGIKAIDIVKKHKKMKNEKGEKGKGGAEAEAEDDADMLPPPPPETTATTATATATATTTTTTTTTTTKTAQEELEIAIENWSNRITPLKLALEISATLIASTSQDGDEGEKDDNLRDWNSDDEEEMEKIAQQQQQNSSSSSSSPTTTTNSTNENELKQILAKADLPRKAFQLLTAFMSTNPNSNNSHDDVISDLSDLKERAATCVFNVVSTELQLYTTDEEKVAFFKLLLSWVACDVPYIVQTLSVMVSMDPRMAQNFDEKGLTDLLSILKGAGSVSTKMETVGCLGALCGVQHTMQVNQVIGGTLLERLADEGDILVCNEIVNVLMDIYGADDGEKGESWSLRQVFKMLGGAEKLKIFLGLFKRRIKELKRGEEEELIFRMKETSLNTARFVKYIQG